ncbi:restriction endonuclease subunit S [Rothia nasimurium]|uniref:restriction endonuclease subunit S n=1 Tax=Rothia nasimurium TaxID=85336 RepID=UPI001EFF8C5F|nr:restriction endonuclease subunit S [Rothia nasimurium]
MSKDYLRNNPGIYPVYSSQTQEEGVFGTISSYDFDGKFLTWTTDGANAGTVSYRTGKFSCTNVCGILKIKVSDVSLKYIYYALSQIAPRYVNSGMGNPKLMSNKMGEIDLLIPSLAEQERIVDILDRFEALVNDISSGLPAEIAARRKQYEYYRDQLLTFKELQPEAA